MSKRLLRAALLALLVAATGAAPSASAHRVILIGNQSTDRASAIRLTDADIAWAINGTLPAGVAQIIAFTRPTSGMFRARALVSTFQSNTQLNPWLALVGPGLPRPDGLDAFLQDGEGALLFAPPEARGLEMFQDLPFPMLVGASFEAPLPDADGPYFLLIFDPAGRTGPYVIDTGYLLD